MQYVYGVAIVKLKDICNIERGTRVTRNELNDSNTYPVYQNSLVPLGYYANSNKSANTTFIIAAGAAGQVGYSKKEFWAADDCFCLECSELIDSRFIYYVLMKEQAFLLSRVRKASVPRISRFVLDNMDIAFPSVSEQKRIVSILDRFDKLCNDISEGLPAEIEARRKQYEYYRDKLLSFKRRENYNGSTYDCLCVE